VSLLADAGDRSGGASGPTASLLASGGEGERALVVRLGAYWFAMTLTVVSRLHRHASLESTHKVETVHPRVVDPATHSIAPRTPRFIWVPAGGYPDVHAGEETDVVDRLGRVHMRMR
jgi:hypothetical protein